MIAGLSVAVLAGLAVGGYTIHTRRVEAIKAVPAPERFPWALRVVPVVRQDLTAGFPVLATLSSQAEISIVPQISGVIRKIGPDAGEPISKGDLLVRLDTRELEAELSALTASKQAAVEEVALNHKELTRQKTLLQRGFSTQEAVDRLQTALNTSTQKVNQLQSQIEGVKTRLAYGKILSPVDGVIAARLADQGDLATPGTTIYRITAAIGAKIGIEVPQAVLEQVHPGSKITLIHGGETMTVSVSRVFPSLDALSMGSAEADLDDIPFDLPSGARLPGRVILARWTGAFVVPRTALILAPDGETGTVFKVVSQGEDKPARLQQVKVKITASGREGIAVSGAVAEGDRVAVAQENELLKLKGGDPVLPEPERGQ